MNEMKRTITKICSNCGSGMVTDDDGEHESYTYCPNCGDS